MRVELKLDVAWGRRVRESGLKQGLELLLLLAHRAVSIQGAPYCQASFRLAETEETGAVFEAEQSNLDVVCLHAIKLLQNHVNTT